MYYCKEEGKGDERVQPGGHCLQDTDERETPFMQPSTL